MRRIWIGAVFIVGALLAVVLAETPQAKVEMANQENGYKQGDTVKVKVHFDKPANISTIADIDASPPAGSAVVVVLQSAGLQPGQTDAELSGALPVDAPVGEWKLTNARTSAQPSGQPKPFTITGSTTFKVRRREPIVQPDSGTVTFDK